METASQHQYTIVTAYSGKTQAAAYVVTCAGVVCAQGRIELGFPDSMGKELMALLAGLSSIPKGNDVLINTRLEYLRHGCEAILFTDTPISTIAEARGTFAALWRELPFVCDGLGSIQTGRADRDEHERCKCLAAAGESHHEPLRIEQQVLDYLDRYKKSLDLDGMINAVASGWGTFEDHDTVSEFVLSLPRA